MIKQMNANWMIRKGGGVRGERRERKRGERREKKRGERKKRRN